MIFGKDSGIRAAFALLLNLLWIKILRRNSHDRHRKRDRVQVRRLLQSLRRAMVLRPVPSVVRVFVCMSQSGDNHLDPALGVINAAE